jgi:hypothetical protein
MANDSTVDAPAGFQYQAVGPLTELPMAPAIAPPRAPMPMWRKLAPRVPCRLGESCGVGRIPPGPWARSEAPRSRVAAPTAPRE